jgi:hypothetical protein
MHKKKFLKPLCRFFCMGKLVQIHSFVHTICTNKHSTFNAHSKITRLHSVVMFIRVKIFIQDTLAYVRNLLRVIFHKFSSNAVILVVVDIRGTVIYRFRVATMFALDFVGCRSVAR